MTIRRKQFRSNTIMVLLSLFTMFLVASIMMVFVRHYMNDEILMSSQVNNEAFDVQTILNKVDTNSLIEDKSKLQEISAQIEQKGYAFLVKSEGEAISSNLSRREEKMLYSINLNAVQVTPGKCQLYQMQGLTVIYLIDKSSGDKLEFIAIRDRNQNSGKGKLQRPIEWVFVYILVAFVITMLFILLISQLFSRKMLKYIMIPIQALNDAAKRIGSGNMDEPIHYEGTDEFQAVCVAFNEMQNNIKEGIEKNAAYERSRTEMIAGISHDLRTPLTSVKGYIKGLKDGVANTPEKQLQYLNIAYQKSCDMDILLQKLFMFSKLETGGMPFEFVKTDFNEYIRNFIDRTIADYGKQDIHLSLIEKESAVKLSMDCGQMDRVLANLIENSGKYKVEDMVEVQMTIDIKDQELVFTVADNGAGVPSEKLSFLFDRFYRADEARHQYRDGSGLGLSIVKYIVNAHGGQIEASNQSGLAITIRIPLYRRSDNIEKDTNY